MSNHFHTLKIKQLKKETANAVSIVFEVPAELTDTFQYDAGQYLTIKASPNGEELRRSYSISSYSAIDQELQVSCKMIDGGRMSTYLFKNINEGDSLEVMPPMGSFTLDKVDEPLVLFAAGSGITPIISILKKALSEGSNQVKLFYGNRSEGEIIFKSELEALGSKYQNKLEIKHYLSSKSERLDTTTTKNIVTALESDENTAYFICGPEGMISAVKSGLEAAGVAAEKINIEYFASPKTEKPKTESVSAGPVNEVTAIIDGDEHKVTLEDGETILDAANRIGIDPPFSCQSGVCTTCKCKVMSGTVEMENNFGLGEDEEEEGFVLSCISKPTSAGVVVSWDED